MSLFVHLNNSVRYLLTFLCMRISLWDSVVIYCTIIPGRKFMYPNLNIFSGISNTEATCFAKIVVYPLLLAVSTDVILLYVPPKLLP